MLGFLENLMLPESKNPPPGLFELPRLASVARHVLREFLEPERPPGTRQDVVVRATVPEATVDEEGRFSSREYNVGPDTEHAPMETVPEACAIQEATEHELRIGIASAD